ncbi:MAG TPA: NAD(P)-dependent oxidoreductase [Actinomycetota bacterium]|nr:NAD(P)-dependent oxidoreductase [Actinomycetota bacterium]
MKERLPQAAALSRRELDVTDRGAVEKAIAGVDVVVHLAAWTDVDGCEREPDRARSVNVDGTSIVVGAARHTNARVIFLSTDYVFGGDRSTPYREEDPPDPVNVYGRTKADAENVALAYERCLIVRASWVFGDGRNFVRTILDAARANKPLSVVDDQRGVPTPASALADALAWLIERDRNGIIHVAGDGPIVSWAEFAETALETAGMTADVEGVSTHEYLAEARRVVAPRPAYSALDLGKARSLGVPLLDWRAGLKAYIGAMG